MEETGEEDDEEDRGEGPVEEQSREGTEEQNAVAEARWGLQTHTYCTVAYCILHFQHVSNIYSLHIRYAHDVFPIYLSMEIHIYKQYLCA